MVCKKKIHRKGNGGRCNHPSNQKSFTTHLSFSLPIHPSPFAVLECSRKTSTTRSKVSGDIFSSRNQRCTFSSSFLNVYFFFRIHLAESLNIQPKCSPHRSIALIGSVRFFDFCPETKTNQVSANVGLIIHHDGLEAAGPWRAAVDRTKIILSTYFPAPLDAFVFLLLLHIAQCCQIKLRPPVRRRPWPTSTRLQTSCSSGDGTSPWKEKAGRRRSRPDDSASIKV